MGYQYTARDGSCRASSCDVVLPAGTVTGHQNVGQTSSALKSALASQPVSVTVNACQLQFVSNGVVTGQCRGQINHAVIAVGYGTDGLDYFKIRNSWGAQWGERGYIRLAASGVRKGQRACCSTRLCIQRWQMDLCLRLLFQHHWCPHQRPHHLQHRFQGIVMPSAPWQRMTGAKRIAMLASVRQISASVI